MKTTIRKLIQIPYTFVLMNLAAVAGLYCFARGHEGFWNSVPMGTQQPQGLRHV
ncbi:MAG: hypothetical protein JO307_12935 [Bryobacterales bacterium]|nr:hypothetical protein [Bryobacterales bacterium]MBV9401762.1 hypothetical protein [Bryobacterales bacterium]